jgi:hypothetical protein
MMGAHQSARSESVDWLTPPAWIAALGTFDLDPCAALRMPWSTARVMWDRADDGLSRAWQGRVWLNPPYGTPRVIEPWMARMATHRDGIALIFARTETACWFKYVWGVAHSVLFVAGRPHFYDVQGQRAPGNSGAPVALIAYTAADRGALEGSGIRGKLVTMER